MRGIRESGRWWRCRKHDPEEEAYIAATLERMEAAKRGEAQMQTAQPANTQPMYSGRMSHDKVESDGREQHFAGTDRNPIVDA